MHLNSRSPETAANIIAIDGPAAAGKSTLGRELAMALDYLYFDTGVMYRAVTCGALGRGVAITDPDAVSAFAREVPIDVRPASHEDGRDNDIWIGGKDITWTIRSPEVDANVSAVASYPGVRSALTAQQRRIGLRGRIVMVGRDIGTVVLPEADLKIFLDAGAEKRAQRRHEERLSRGERSEIQSILDDLIERDRIDSTRRVAPLKPADDAIILNSSDMSAEKVLEYAIDLAYGRIMNKRR
jgi:cytidylate kinase